MAAMHMPHDITLIAIALSTTVTVKYYIATTTHVLFGLQFQCMLQ